MGFYSMLDIKTILELIAMLCVTAAISIVMQDQMDRKDGRK